MHKGVILLVKATDKDEAIEKVNDFMEPYGNGDVWDWFQIGGRWNNTLAPKELVDQFNIKVDNHILKKEEHGFISSKQVEEKKKELQDAWEELGLKGSNPYCDHYKLPTDGNEYDAVPLSDCIVTVKEWLQDLDKMADGYFEKLVEEREKEKGGKKGTMSAYYAGLYKDVTYQNFSFESNVYDIDTDAAESIPEDVTGYYAVMVDMHN